jgi:hypothetical protein
MSLFVQRRQTRQLEMKTEGRVGRGLGMLINLFFCCSCCSHCPLYHNLGLRFWVIKSSLDVLGVVNHHHLI